VAASGLSSFTSIGAPGNATGGVGVHKFVHIPNMLKGKGNRKIGEIGGEESVVQIDRKTL